MCAHFFHFIDQIKIQTEKPSVYNPNMINKCADFGVN